MQVEVLGDFFGTKVLKFLISHLAEDGGGQGLLYRNTFLGVEDEGSL